ncbi:helix-turn-helix domain-containing protein [Streptomyces sp. NPDC007808]|uniref:nSTAND1 domain-containing NTPase n=1 Tax=Streptomyces sp. NPDC007808 TaxID=3364779 RepID=UPI00369E575B
MGRRETPVDPAAGPVQRFAYELRKLRQEAGGITYRELARRAHYSVTALSQAAAGEQLPSLQVALAYVRACGGDEDSWERRWQETEREVRDAAAREDDGAEPPYQGLARFEPGDHDRYFGRDRLVTALRQLVSDRRFTALFGPSGSGKSSLLRAGLVPALRTEPDLAAIRILTPGEHPVRTHADALKPGPTDDTVIVVDQFEEVFTLCRDPQERREFIDLLLGARRPGSGLRVVIAVRADFYGRCAEHRGLADALGEAGLLVGPMDSAELREVIVKPAQAAGLIVERTLTARLVEEIAGEPGGLPLLSHVLRETWRRRRGRALTMEAYEAAGGVHGAIAQTAEELYAELSTEHAHLARLILLRLITPGEGSQDTRRPVDRSELDFADPAAGSADVTRVLDRLARARLITLDHDTADLAHEALITAWPRLSGWIDEEREHLRTHRRLTEAARTWDELGRDPGALYRGTRLAAAQEQLAGASLTALERTFLTASGTAHQGERRRRRGLVGTLAVLLVLALVAGAVAWQQNRAGDRRRVEAEARRVAAVADSMRFSDPVTAMRLSVAAWQLADTTETRSALIGAMAQREEDVFAVPGADSGPNDQSSTEVRRLTADGSSVVSVTADRVRVWDLRTHRLTLSRRGPGRLMDNGGEPYLSPDGRTLAVPTGDALKLWDIRNARVTGTLGVSPLDDVRFSLDGRTLVAEDWPTESDNSVTVWDLRSHRRLLRVQERDDEILQSSAISPDGRTLALCTSERGLEIWDVAGRRKASAPWAARVPRGDCVPEALDITPDGRTLTFLTEEGIRRWDLGTGRKLPTLESPTGVNDVWFAGRGAFLLARGDEQLFMWRTTYDYAPVLRQRSAGSVSDVSVDTTAGVVRYLNGSGTVVRSLALGRSTTSQWDSRLTYAAQLSGDGRLLARMRRADGVVRLHVVDVRSGRVVFQPPGDGCPDPAEEREDGASCADLMALSADGRYVAHSRSWNHVAQGLPDRTRITVWDTRTRRVHAAVDIRADRTDTLGVNGLAFDARARTLLVYRASDQPSVEAWDLSRRKRLLTVRGRATASTSYDSVGVSPVANPRGDRLVTKEGFVAEVRPGGKVEPRLLNEDMNSIAAFSPDGRYLAAGDHLGRVTLWDGALRKRLGVLDGNVSDTETDTIGGVTALAFSHDGSTLAVAGDAAGTVQLWDVTSSRLLGSTLPTPGDEVQALAFGQDDTTLYAAGLNTPVQKYDLTPAHLITQVCDRTGTGLSRTDWKTYLPDVPYRRTC